MKNRKRQVELLSFYDHTGIENRLAEMARKGWMVEKISNVFWTYRKIEPQELHFTVSYFPKASDFDPAPSEAQQTLMDFCAETGWKLACTWFQMQVFYNAKESPTPIHTEPVQEVETLHRACKKNFLLAYKILFVFSLVFTFLFLSSLFSDTLRLLASPGDFTMGMCCLVLFVLCFGELITYYAWHRKAKKAARYALFLDTPSTSGLQKLLFIILALCIVYWLVNLIFAGKPLMVWIALTMFLCMAALILLVHAVKGLLKKKQVSANLNRVLTIAASFLFSFALMGGVVFIGIQLISHMQPEDLPLYAQAPLQITDLVETEYGAYPYLTTESPDESLFLKRLEIQQRHSLEDEASPEIPELAYEIYTVKVPALYSFCESQLKRLTVLSAYWKGELVSQDAAPWRANEAYRLIMDSGEQTNQYLLCYDNMLVQITFNWQPTAEQMDTVGMKLAGSENG